MHDEVDEQLYRVRTAAERAAVSESTIRRLVAEGALPAVRVRGRLRIRRSDLSRLIAAGDPSSMADGA